MAEKEEKKTTQGEQKQGELDLRSGEPGEGGEGEAGDVKTVTVDSGEFEELQEQARERDDYLERLRRAIAENLNLQNRMEKVRQSAGREAMRELSRRVVPLADSLKRAIENAEKTDGAEAICEGLRLTEKEFYEILGKLEIEPIEALGQRFDPHYHDAVYHQPTDEFEPDTVVDELKKGFLIGGELLRPSQVVVAAPPRDPDDAPDGRHS